MKKKRHNPYEYIILYNNIGDNIQYYILNTTRNKHDGRARDNSI